MNLYETELQCLGNNIEVEYEFRNVNGLLKIIIKLTLWVSYVVRS